MEKSLNNARIKIFEKLSHVGVCYSLHPALASKLILEECYESDKEIYNWTLHSSMKFKMDLELGDF